MTIFQRRLFPIQVTHPLKTMEAFGLTDKIFLGNKAKACLQSKKRKLIPELFALQVTGP